MLPARSWPFGETPATVNHATAQATPGDLFIYKDSTYGIRILRYAQFKDAVTYADGQVLTLAAADKSAVTNDVAGGSSLGSLPGGVALAAVTQNYYGAALVWGQHPSIKDNGDDDIAAGNNLIIGASDGVCDSGTGTVGWFGQATAADNDGANTVAGFVNCI
jgi:hypothetical protein